MTDKSSASVKEFQIYHNPRCSKSRDSLALLEANGVTPEIIRYLDNPPTQDELKTLLRKLGVGIRDILRRNEPAYAALGLDDATMSEEAVLDLVVSHPVLIERPIVVKGDHAVLGRPPQTILQLLKAHS